MRLRIRLFALGKTAVSADASWLPVAPLLVWTLGDFVFPGLVPGLPPAHYWAMALAGSFGLFVCVVIREGIQALIADRRGIPVDEIRLYVFGGLLGDRQGVAPARFWRELALSAGALSVSAGLGAAILLGLFQGATEGTHLAPGGVALFLGLANLVLAAFNLLPAYPASGGRLLRAALLRWTATPSRATRIAATVGVVVSTPIAASGIFLAFSGGSLSLHAGLWLALSGLILCIAGGRNVVLRKE